MGFGVGWGGAPGRGRGGAGRGKAGAGSGGEGRGFALFDLSLHCPGFAWEVRLAGASLKSGVFLKGKCTPRMLQCGGRLDRALPRRHD